MKDIIDKRYSSLERRTAKDSHTEDIFYTYSAYEMKNLLIQCEFQMRILILPAECTYRCENLYAAHEMLGYTHDGLLKTLKKNLIALRQNAHYEEMDELYWFPKKDYKTAQRLIQREFSGEYPGSEDRAIYETDTAWIADEDDHQLGRDFCTRVMRGKKV